MKTRRPSWPEIAAQMARRGSAVPRTGAAGFWEAFEARRHLYPQHPAPAATHPRRAPWFWACGSLGATSLLALGAWLLFLQPAPVQARAAIHSYEIDPEHGAVMIINDETSHAAILWVANLDVSESASQTEPME